MSTANIAFIPGVSAHRALYFPKVHAVSKRPVPQFEASGALKLATLLYEQIVFDWTSQAIDEACRYSKIDRPNNWVSADEYSSITGVNSFRQYLDSRELTDPKKFYSALGDLTTELDALCGDETTIVMDDPVHQAMASNSVTMEKSANSLNAIQSIFNWSAFNVSVQSTLTCLTSFERAVATAYFGMSDDPRPTTINHNLTLPFFDFDQVSWESVKSYGADPRLKEFHEWVNSGLANQSVDVSKEMTTGMFELLSRLGNPNKAAKLNLGLSCMPLPIPVNPVSIGLGVKDMVESRKLNREYGWLFAFMEVAHSVEQTNDNPAQV
ncbi:hypothetical protein [Shimia sp.]|uniref:hypothetical protein n=1 Tax=Shimia sp. TaxID=1954381 RepID=UPI0032981C64